MGRLEFTGDADADPLGTIETDVDHVPDNMAPHFASAYEDGAIAYRRGKDKSDNPYYARYNAKSAMGGEWGHVWVNAWRLGWTNEKRIQNGEQPYSYRKAWKIGR